MIVSGNGKIELLRVLQVGMHERSSGGGVDRVFWDLWDNLTDQSGIDTKGYFFRHRSEAVSERRGEYCLGSTSLSLPQRLLRVRRTLFDEFTSAPQGEPILVASHFALYAAALLPRLCRVKHVVHFHGPWASESATEGKNRLNVGLKRRLEQAVYSTADAFITLSQAFRKLLIEEYQVKAELVHVVPAGVDLKRFVLGSREAARRRLGWSADATIVLCVRRLARRMGLEILIEAFRRVADAHPQALLLLGGTGALRDELSTIIDRDGLKNQVRLLGFIPEDELVPAYQAADLSIVPSQSLEGFGLTTLESLACGTPVVVTPVGGLPEAVSGLAPQLVLAGRSADALAERLHVFFQGKLSVPAPEQCRQHVENNFGWPALGAKIKSLYWKVGTSAP